jgi:hypothetical protein
MALPAQGGLNQVSAQPKPVVPAGGAKPPTFDVNAAQAENLEKMSGPNLRDVVSDELGDQREALNSALVRMRASLDNRKNRMFDPVLMQVAAGLLKPTKTGSFGESLGYAAEGAGVAAEGEMLRQRENQKLEMELLGKEQELRKMMAGDQFMSALLGGNRRTAPTGGATAVPTGGAGVPSATSPVGVASAQRPPTNQEVMDAAVEGRIKITEEVLALAQAIDPAKATFLKGLREQQLKEDQINLERQKVLQATRKVKIRGSDLEREMTAEQYDRYEKALNQYLDSGDYEKFADYLERNNLLEPSQVRGREPVRRGAPEAGDATVTGGARPPVPPPMSAAERDAEAAQMSEQAKERAKASEARGNMVLERGQNATNMEGLANDVLSLTDSNARAFNLMQNATVRDSLLRAIEQGASVTAGPMTVALNLPVRVALQGNKEYKLTNQDIEALQVFQQKQSAITAEMRKMARTPGEGATDKTEGQLYAAIGLLPTDSAKVLALKAEAMVQRARYDARAAELWSKFQEDFPNKSFTYFRQNNPEFKQLQNNYVRTLNDMREKNADTLRTSPKKSSASETPPASAPANETPLQKFQRERAERERKAQGNQ